MASRELILTFLGTGAMKPSVRRGASSLGMVIPTIRGSEYWLFDCGEGTYRQMCQFNKLNLVKRMEDGAVASTGRLKFGCQKLNRIFVSHLHGDHIFGLPSIILGIGFDQDGLHTQHNQLTLYGPPGIGEYLSTCLRFCASRIGYKVNIFELCQRNQTCSFISATDQNRSYISVKPIYPESDGFWNCFDEDFGSIRAGSLSHNISTFGFSYVERDQPGNINPNMIIPVLSANKERLEQLGSSVYKMIKRLKNGERLILPDSTILDPTDSRLISAVKKGRHVTVLGDTRSAMRMANLIVGSDLLVHEATVGPISTDIGLGNEITMIQHDLLKKEEMKRLQQIESNVRTNGHSTAREAGEFARKMDVKKLVLNHISNRYDQMDDNCYHQVVEAIRDTAIKAFGSSEVVVPDDYQTVILEGIKRDII